MDDTSSIFDVVYDTAAACSKVWFDKIWDNVAYPSISKTADYSDSNSRIFPNKVGIMAPIVGYGPPSRIIDNIYLGSAFNAASKLTLKKYDIRFVMNITAEISNYFEDNKAFGYQKFALYDNNKESIADYLQNTYDMIKKNQNKGGNILVHCFAGRSRSASIVAYYIMREQGISPLAAFNKVLEERPIINPTQKFLDDLNIIFNEVQLVKEKKQNCQTDDDKHELPNTDSIYAVFDQDESNEPNYEDDIITYNE